MPNLQYRQNKIIEKRKQTSFRDFLKDMTSWFPYCFYKRGNIITNLADSDRINKEILNPLEFDERRDELIKKGLDYNPDKNFFLNIQDLFKSIPWYSLFSFSAENSSYADNVYNSKNAYLSNGVVHDCENVYYSFYIKQNSKNIFNSIMCWDNCENIYFGVGIVQSFNIFYSRNIYNSNNIWFSSNLNGCRECIFCESLENESFCINNDKYSKEEYLIKKEEILGKKDKFEDYYNSVNKKGLGPYSKNSSGFFLPFCEDIKNGYFSYNVHTGKNIMFMGSKEGNTEFYDCFGGGSPKGDRYYGGCWVGTYAEDLYITHSIDYSKFMFYSIYCTNCSYCLGCIGLKNKSYCILNQEYSKEAWLEKVNEIFKKMEIEGILGDYFPGYINPYNFNDTIAGILGDFKKEEVIKAGYLRRDEVIKVDIPEGSKIVYINPPQSTFSIKGGSINEMNTGGLLSNYQGYDENGKWYINLEILKKVIKDSSGDYYRIVKIEYDFLMKYKLPIPKSHWMKRVRLNFGI